jgi:hypothetical protein
MFPHMSLQTVVPMICLVLTLGCATTNGDGDKPSSSPGKASEQKAAVEPAEATAPPPQTSTLKKNPGGWIMLFDGTDLSKWESLPNTWTIEDGLMTCLGGAAGPIWTKETYGNFILELDFKLPPKGNSGVFVRTGEVRDMVQTGIEIQVLDSHGKTPLDKHDCGAVYDCLEPAVDAARPAGEWNHYRILCRDNAIRVRLNGKPVVNMDLDRWSEAGKNPDGTPNKYKNAVKDFPRQGVILLQDHGDKVWYRNIKIRRLD